VNYLNNILNSLSANELKSWELIVLNSFLDKLDLSYGNYITLLLNDLKEYYEVFLKIRGDLLGQDLKENTLKIISFIKEVTDSLEDKAILSKANNYTKQIKEIDEYIKEVDTKISDYEYYIISKDVSLTRIPFANIWFEFILYSYWLYENNISLNTLKNLYEYRTKDSFDNAFKWYEIYIIRIFNKQSIKNELYKNINQKLNEIKDFISSLYLQIVNNYPNKVEISNSWANLFYDILNYMDKLEKEIHITYNSKELKGSGIFENLYDIIYKVYSEDLPIVSLHNLYSYLNDIVNDLQKNEDSLLTPYDKLVLDNIDLFNEFLVTINNYFLDYENKDLLVDIWLYFDSKIKPILLNIINDYKDIEKIFESKKIVCFKCGFENEYYNEYCSKCNSKLIKPKIESQSNIKVVFNQFKENYLSNLNYSKFLYAFINLINNTVINFESIYRNLENLPKEGEVLVLLEKIENILGILTDIKNNLALFVDLADNNEKKELIETIEINIEELEKLLNDFNNYITNLQTNVRSI
jgi:ribosomal protein L40E